MIWSVKNLSLLIPKKKITSQAQIIQRSHPKQLKNALRIVFTATNGGDALELAYPSDFFGPH